MWFYFLVFLLFFLPFLVFPIGVSFFETIKIFVFEICVFLLFFILLFKNKIDFKKLIESKKIIFGIFLLSLVGFIFNNTDISLFGNAFRLQGTFLLWSLLLFSLIIPYIKSKNNFGYFPHIAFLLTVISILLFGFEENGRVIGTIGEPNALAANIVFLWPFVIAKFKQKYIKPVVIVLTILLIILTGSRSGIIALLMQIIFFGLSYFSKLKLNLISIIVVLLMFISLVLPYFDKQTIFQNRTEVWRTGMEAGLMYPITGSGFGNMEIAIQEAANKLQNNIRFQYVDSGHNLILDYFIQGGIVGLGLILALIILTVRKFINEKNKLYLGIFFGLLTMLLFNPASVVGLIHFWFLVGTVEDL